MLLQLVAFPAYPTYAHGRMESSAGDFPGLLRSKMAEKVVIPQSYDPTIAALVVDANCNKLVNSMDPVSIAPKLVSCGLISSQQAQDVLGDPVQTRSERNLAFHKLIKSSPSQTWFSSLLEVIGEEGAMEQLKKVLEESELL